MTDITGTVPPPPDFPIRWANVEDQTRFWVGFSQYWPLPFTPLEQDIFGPAMGLGSDRTLIYFQAGRHAAHFFNGYIYTVIDNVPALSPAQCEAVKADILAPLVNPIAAAPSEPMAFQAWYAGTLAEVKHELIILAQYDLTQPLSTLLAYLDDALQRVIHLFELHSRQQFMLDTILFEFRQFHQDLFGQDGGNLHQLLHQYEPYLTKGSRRLWELSRQIQRQPALQALVLNTAPAMLMSQLAITPEGQALLAELHAYLADYGKQGEFSSYLRFPYWIEDPTPVLLNLQTRLTQPEREVAVKFRRKQQRQAAAVATMHQQLAAYPQPVIDQYEVLLNKAQKAVYMLDEHTYWMELTPYYHVRLLLLAIGRAFQQAGCLAQADDIFYLWRAELAPLAARPRPQTALMAERKAELARWQQLTPPPTIGPVPTEPPPPNPVMDALSALFFVRPLPPSADPKALAGYGASSGIVQGTVKVLRSLDDAAKLAQGDILVTSINSPTWTPIFSLAAGIITDSGGMLSHAAIVAREMGIPAVVGTGQASFVLQDGQQVLLDGTTGQVRILGPQNAAAA